MSAPVAAPVAPVAPDTLAQATWHFWRGTPELFAHVVRTAERAVGDDGSPVLTTIDVAVADDHELFASVQEFLEQVTLDALRKFASISATVTSGDDRAHITLRWTRPWWAVGRGMDADVTLEVTGLDDRVAERHARIQHALLRGGTQRENVQALIGLSLAALVAAAAAASVLSGGFLLKINSATAQELTLVAAAVGFIAGLLWGTWAYPSIEVAPRGQTNLRRIVRTVGPVVLTVVLAGVTKKLFG